ncbi:2-deoxystreptamine glucosyltransferase [bacterium HR11]|nr:2-deoxystreptamine glucosyltransferase [bacterium HR11]
MKVVIDYRPALRNPTGVGLYARWLIQHMAEAYPDVQWYVFSSSWSDRLGRPPWADAPHVRAVDRRWPVRLLNYVWPRWGWPRIERLIGASVDIAHSPYPLVLPTRTARTVITVHDLWFLRPDAGTEAEIARDYPRFFYTACQRADRILTVSETVARQLGDLYPEVRDRIRVTPLGVPPEFLAPLPPDSAAEVRRAYSLPEEYVLFVGALNRRKNPGLAAEVVRILQSRRRAGPWVVVGQGPLEADLRERQRRYGLTAYFIGYVPRERLPAIYGGATLLLMTSHDEGFGIPLLEAMASGVPVVALRRGAVPEVVGEAAVLVDEADAEALAEACERVLTDSALRADLIERGRARARHFRWSETARRTYEAYREVLG